MNIYALDRGDLKPPCIYVIYNYRSYNLHIIITYANARSYVSIIYF